MTSSASTASPAAPIPPGDDRLADRDDDHQPVAFDEVGGGDLEAALALAVADPRRAPLQDGGDGPQHRLRGPAEGAPGDDEQRVEEVVGGDAEERARRLRRGGPDEQRRVDRDDDEVAHAEGQAAAMEGAGDGEGQHEVAGHAAEQDRPLAQLASRDRVGQPRVAGVHPPDQREHDHDLAQRLPREVMAQHRGELRDREDEDEVEEQLERGDALNRRLRCDVRPCPPRAPSLASR